MALGSVAKNAFHVSSAKLWEKMTKVINTIIIFFGTLSEFFLILAKKNVRCVETVIKSTEGKTSKNTLEKLVFRLFWNLTRKNCIYTRKFLAGLSKLLSTFPEEHLRRNISERKSWKLKNFWIIFEVLGTMAENIFQGWQISNRCPREQFMESFFFKREKFVFFSDSERLLLPAKNFARVTNPAFYVTGEVFGEKHFLIFI